MLVKDPGQRISISDIVQHPWFQCNMPAGLPDLNTRVDPSKAKQVRMHGKGWGARACRRSVWVPGFPPGMLAPACPAGLVMPS